MNIQKDQSKTGPLRSIWIMLLLLAVTLLLNAAAWLSTDFADWFAGTVFPIVSEPLARITGLLPFSLGEWLLPAAVIWILFFAFFLLVCGILTALRRCPMHLARVRRRLTRATGWLTVLVLLIMTLNCFLLYHVTPVENSFSGYEKEYSIEELGELRDFVVEQCNRLAEEMPRDADSNEVIYEGGFERMAETAREAMAQLGGSNVIFARLSGWSTTPKPLYFSDFVSQQYIQGYYFPFTMEANINTVMKTTNQPATMCHELSHTHGYIYEDEANLIGFLACIGSDDPVFRYSGWLSVLNYVNNSFYKNVDTATYRSHTAISDLVRWDNQFLSDEAWEAVEEDAVLSTETVKAATDIYLDTTLKANGVESGKASYTHVVELLLMYYDGNYD